MPYLITAMSAEGVVTFQSKTAVGALETAAQLAEFGLIGNSHHQ
jgi:hypothetical protein